MSTHPMQHIKPNHFWRIPIKKDQIYQAFCQKLNIPFAISNPASWPNDCNDLFAADAWASSSFYQRDSLHLTAIASRANAPNILPSIRMAYFIQYKMEQFCKTVCQNSSPAPTQCPRHELARDRLHFRLPQRRCNRRTSMPTK